MASIGAYIPTLKPPPYPQLVVIRPIKRIRLTDKRLRAVAVGVGDQ